jgi:hypothetical protein
MGGGAGGCGTFFFAYRAEEKRVSAMDAMERMTAEVRLCRKIYLLYS